MIPILYDSASVNISSFGDYGKMVDVTRCEMTESVTGEFALEFDYPVYGPLYNALLGAVSVVATNPDGNNELFDVYKRSIPIDGVVTFYCNHISRRFADHIVASDFKLGGTPSLTVIPSNTYNGATGAITRDFAGATNTVHISAPKSVLAAIAGDSESLAALGYEIYYKTDFSPIDGTPTFSAVLTNRRGADNGAFVRFGANMVNIEYVTDETETYNAFFPYWTDGNGNIIKPTGNAIAQPTTPITPIKAVPLDLTQAFQTQPTSAEMLAYATDLLDATTPWVVAKTVTVDMINGPEVDIHAVPVSIGDTVHVFWTDAGINETLRMVSYTYDVLGETYTEIKLGTPQTEFVATTGQAATGSGTGGGGVTSVNGMTGDVTLAGELRNGTNAASMSVPNASYTTVSTVSLDAGTWLITAGQEWTTSFTQMTVTQIFTPGEGGLPGCTVRFTGENGGGVNLATIHEVSSTETVGIRVYQASGSSKTAKNVSLKAYKLL